MHLQSIIVHNFRSVIHQKFNLRKYSSLIGENNSGKTNIIRALRIFYEDGIKFETKSDFPRFDNLPDEESWIELEFLTTEKEQNTHSKNSFS